MRGPGPACRMHWGRPGVSTLGPPKDGPGASLHPHYQVTFLPRGHHCVPSGPVTCTCWERRDKWGGGWDGKGCTLDGGWWHLTDRTSDPRTSLHVPPLLPVFLWGEVGVPCPRSGDHRGCGHQWSPVVRFPTVFRIPGCRLVWAQLGGRTVGSGPRCFGPAVTQPSGRSPGECGTRPAGRARLQERVGGCPQRSPWEKHLGWDLPIQGCSGGTCTPATSVRLPAWCPVLHVTGVRGGAGHRCAW